MPNNIERERSHITWRQVAIAYPTFVQWVVQKFVPLPEGDIKRQDYEKFKEAYEEASS